MRICSSGGPRGEGIMLVSVVNHNITMGEVIPMCVVDNNNTMSEFIPRYVREHSNTMGEVIPR